jgi:hyperosmotically inducible protein
MKTNTKKCIIFALILGGLAISTSACRKPQESSPTTSTLSSEVADSVLTMKVKAALVENETLRPYHIDVVTTNGDVGLTGFVDTQTQIDLAIELVRKIQGVHAIHEHMTIGHDHLGNN